MTTATQTRERTGRDADPGMRAHRLAEEIVGRLDSGPCLGRLSLYNVIREVLIEEFGPYCSEDPGMRAHRLADQVIDRLKAGTSLGRLSPYNVIREVLIEELAGN